MQKSLTKPLMHGTRESHDMELDSLPPSADARHTTGLLSRGRPSIRTHKRPAVTKEAQQCIIALQQATRCLRDTMGIVDAKSNQQMLCNMENLLWGAQDAIQQARQQAVSSVSPDVPNPGHNNTMHIPNPAREAEASAAQPAATAFGRCTAVPRGSQRSASCATPCTR